MYIVYLLDHLLEGLPLVLLELLVILDAGHVELVLGLGLGGLKRTGQDGNVHVLQLIFSNSHTTK